MEIQTGTKDGPMEATKDGPAEATKDGRMEATKDGQTEGTNDGMVRAAVEETVDVGALSLARTGTKACSSKTNPKPEQHRCSQCRSSCRTPSPHRMARPPHQSKAEPWRRRCTEGATQMKRKEKRV